MNKIARVARGGFSSCCAVAAVTLVVLGIVGCRDDAWRVDVARIDDVPLSPPAELFAGTNYPYASIMCSIEDPVNNGMDPEKFSALQKCLGESICPHSRREVTSVRDGLDAALFEFWDKYLNEVRQGTFESEFAILEINTKVAYMGPEYLGYVVEYQEGCSCCAGETNVVWSWSMDRSLRSADIVRADSVEQLRMMLRAAVKRYFADDYGDAPEMVLPDYAKDWPHTIENFIIDERGISWSCDAGEVLFGGKGPCSFRLSWEELSPVLREDFKLPAKLPASVNLGSNNVDIN